MGNHISPEWRRELDAWRRSQRASGMAASSIALRHGYVERLARYCGERGPWEVTGTDLIDWVSAHDWSRETIRSARSSVRTFYGWAVRTDRTSDNPSEELPRVQPSQPRPHPTPQSGYSRALALATRRERAMLMLAGECGLRRAEVARVHRRDIVEDWDTDLGKCWSLVVHGKGDKQRIVPLPNDLAAALKALCLEGGGYAFPGNFDGHLSPHWVGKLIARALPDGYSMHSLRHRAGTDFHRENGGDLLLTQEFLGHASPATTQVYIANDRRRMRAAVNRVARAR